MMNHDYAGLQIHYARAADLQAEARQHRVVRQALRAKRVLAQLTAPASVRTLPRRDAADPAAGEGRDAAA